MPDCGGYAGKFLRVDLTNEKTSEVTFDEELLRQYVGGAGIGAKILYEEVNSEADWSDPENRLIYASGPLGGTRVGGSGSFSLVTKGALTNGATSVQANGLFGAYIKFCGYDGVIVQGAASRWLYLNVNDHGVELREASYLLGRDTYETVDLLTEDLGKKARQVSVISIGPAGEHQVKFAGVFAEKGHSASHNGPGAVMGSKRLKAIAVSRGKEKVKVKDEERLAKIVEELYQNVKTFSGTVGGVYGSHMVGRGTLPIKNYLTNIWDISEEEIEGFSEEYVRKTYHPKANPCWACRLNHAT
ncbi:MAG: hypothetical protein JSW53_03000, partial [Candidatus Bathyarchaeota archaeon]